ncbi:MAG: phage shock protein [Actinomycetota bacterium]|jgi:rhodanese-related sulfurtransferase|nr:phage shock protein [Actinomycetota bacterium]
MTRAQLQEMLASRPDVQLVEVLPKDEFDEEHLPGAVHIPLRKIAERAPTELDVGRPVVVYCWDSL